jgi:hypothetical protein
MEAPMQPRSPFRYPPSGIKPVPSILDLALRIGTALLMCFAATLILVHAGIYFAQPLIVS